MYLNLIQIAESFGVPERVILGWIRDEGLPHTDDRGRLLFDRAQVADWAAKRGLASQVGFLAPERARFGPVVRVAPMLRIGGIWRDVAPEELNLVLERVVDSLPTVAPPVRSLLLQRLRAPGGVTIAPIGGGFALPHPSARIHLGRDAGAIALIFLRAPLPLAEPAVDGEPVTALLFFIAPTPRVHLELLGSLARLLSRGPLAALIRARASDSELFAAVADDESRSDLSPREAG